MCVYKKKIRIYERRKKNNFFFTISEKSYFNYKKKKEKKINQIKSKKLIKSTHPRTTQHTSIVKKTKQIIE